LPDEEVVAVIVFPSGVLIVVVVFFFWQPSKEIAATNATATNAFFNAITSFRMSRYYTIKEN